MEKEMEKKKFYKTTWFLIVLGIFLPAIAMVLLWLQKERSQMQKIVFTIIFSAWWLLGFLTNSIIMNKNKSPKVEQSSLSVAETTIQEETEMISESNEEKSTEVESNGNTEADPNNETVDITTETSTTTTEPPSISYDHLQNIFLSLTYSSTQNDLLSMINSEGLAYTVDESNTRPRQISYKIAFDEETAKHKYATPGDNIVVLFNQDDGTFMKAEYINYSKFLTALFYCYGWDSKVSSENEYSGYYYYKPGDFSKEGIVIEYSNGNKEKTSYYACASAEKALEMVSD